MVWALWAYGIEAVLAPGFGEIFDENAFRNRLLLVVLPAKTIASIADSLDGPGQPLLAADLELPIVETPAGAYPFTYPDDRRLVMLEGMNEIDTTMRHMPKMEAFRASQREEDRWMYQSRGKPS